VGWTDGQWTDTTDSSRRLGEPSRPPSPPSFETLGRRNLTQQCSHHKRKRCPHGSARLNPAHQLGHCNSHRGAGGKWDAPVSGECTLGSAGKVHGGARPQQRSRTWPLERRDATTPNSTEQRCSPATGQFGRARCSDTQLPSRRLWLARRRGTHTRARGGVAPKPAVLHRQQTPPLWYFVPRVSPCVKEAHEVRLRGGAWAA
jgi:hypothetical protein